MRELCRSSTDGVTYRVSQSKHGGITELLYCRLGDEHTFLRGRTVGNCFDALNPRERLT